MQLRQLKRRERNKKSFIDVIGINFPKKQIIKRSKLRSAIIKNSSYKKIADVMDQICFLKLY